MNYEYSNFTLPVFYAPEKTENVGFEYCRLGSDRITALHYHNTAELGFCISGTGTTYVGNKIYKFSPGDIQILPPYTPHLSNAEFDGGAIWIFITADVASVMKDVGIISPKTGLELGFDGKYLCGVFSADEYPTLTSALHKIYEASEKKDEYTRLSIAISVLDFLISAARVKATEKDTVYRYVRSSKKIAAALSVIDTNLDDNEALSEDKLARAVGMSVANLRREFIKQTSYPPKTFIIRSRMAYAEYLLRNTKMTVIEIACLSGYGEISGFNRTFKRYFGTTPKKYRKDIS